MPEARTFTISSSPMKGDDIKMWQREIKNAFNEMDIDCPIVVDGVYGFATRSYMASLCYALGMDAGKAMKDGITPALRTRIRHHQFSDTEKASANARVEWRRRLRKKYESSAIIQVHRPVDKILEDSWGFHPGVHDGLDVICPPDAVCYAMVKSKIIDVRASGWWGANPTGDVSKGDGILQMEVLETIGPFKKGFHIGYGHNEKAFVKVGQIVNAGDKVAHAGLAVAWHIHLMYNEGNTSQGRGNIDPRPILNYAVQHG